MGSSFIAVLIHENVSMVRLLKVQCQLFRFEVDVCSGKRVSFDWAIVLQAVVEV